MKTVYVEVNSERTQILGTGPRPEWTYEGQPVGEDVLAAGGYKINHLGKVVFDTEGRPILAENKNGWVPLLTLDYPAADPLLEKTRLQDENEWVIESHRVVRDWVRSPLSLIAVKGAVISKIDELAESARSVFLTTGGPGQALEYDETRREVEQWDTDPAPNIAEYPMLNAEFRARQIEDAEISPDAVVADTKAQVELWKMVGALIKEARRTGKVAAELAESPVRLREVYDWAELAFQQITQNGTMEPLTP